MSEEINTQQQQTQQDPTPGAKGGRTFTQDDVNRIVSERLAHEREKLQASAKDTEREKLQASAKDTEREKALAAREARLDCREYLDTQGYPTALLDVLDSSDTDKFKAAVEKLVKAFPAITGTGSTPRKYVGWTPGSSSAPKDGSGGPDPIRAAFKPK
mgnify:CR=1 FL=1